MQNSKQTEPCQTETTRQPLTSEHQHALQIQQTVCQSQKPLGLYVDGFSAAITSENLKTHFQQFGEVLEVDMSVDDSTNVPSGNAYITLQPTVDPNQILETEHVVCGVSINVEECYSSSESHSNSEW
ncbi:unnamed protein product [Dibothriocephalus latus]|uniref:RRM domain-containing protein n=1 Tax=Dibothriocephalus latus TaxID=60516 RepID=A0A3P6Q3Z7_DIBLA|nr:unnamed protein product [Dibothriocephalus latus]